MKSSKWKQNYPDLLIFLSGVLIGFTPILSKLWEKFVYIIIAIIFILLVGYIRKKEKGGNSNGLLGKV